jgi:hypothetical protein
VEKEGAAASFAASSPLPPPPNFHQEGFVIDMPLWQPVAASEQASTVATRSRPLVMRGRSGRETRPVSLPTLSMDRVTVMQMASRRATLPKVSVSRLGWK